MSNPRDIRGRDQVVEIRMKHDLILSRYQVFRKVEDLSPCPHRIQILCGPVGILEIVASDLLGVVGRPVLKYYLSHPAYLFF